MRVHVCPRADKFLLLYVYMIFIGKYLNDDKINI